MPYIQLVLDSLSNAIVTKEFPAIHPTTFINHITLFYDKNATKEELKQRINELFLNDSEAVFEIVSHVVTQNVQYLICKCISLDTIVRKDNFIYHITLSTDKVFPVEAKRHSKKYLDEPFNKNVSKIIHVTGTIHVAN